MKFIQPLANLCTLGSVSGGKSTCIEALTGEKTQKHCSEKVRNITMKAGYQNMKIFQDINENYSSTSGKKDLKNQSLVHHLSFVDCPGHQQLTQIMLGQVDLVVGAITVISMAENISTNNQLIEHLKAAKLAGLKKIIVCLNKCDLVSKEEVVKKYTETLELFKTIGLDEPLSIIPTSFNKKLNINYLLKAIMLFFNPTDFLNESNDNPFFSVSRSFDINKPGNDILKVQGGVFGGSLLCGKLKVGDTIVIKPGHIINNKGKVTTNPIKTKILSIMSDNTSLEAINPGGLMAIKTDINPNITKADRMVGQIICLENDDSIITTNKFNLDIKFFSKETRLNKNDKVRIQIGPKSLIGTIESTKKKKYSITLTELSGNPTVTCLRKGTKLYIATNDSKIKIIGYSIF
tara:strand:- start:575 stop:1789 length:1215 start_codon:yes stop_codon:yes gene_type:complete